MDKQIVDAVRVIKMNQIASKLIDAMGEDKLHQSLAAAEKKINVEGQVKTLLEQFKASMGRKAFKTLTDTATFDKMFDAFRREKMANIFKIAVNEIKSRLPANCKINQEDIQFFLIEGMKMALECDATGKEP